MRCGCYLLIIAIGLIASGCQELRLANLSSPTPTVYKLSELESGSASVNNLNAKIDKHLEMVPYCVYSYTKRKGSDDKVSSNTSLNYVYYPICSEKNCPPDLQRKVASAIAHRNPDELPKLRHVAVIVKTRRWSSLGQIPLKISRRDALNGLIVNDVDKLDEDEKKLLRDGFDGVDLDKVAILEEGRTPPGKGGAYGQMGAGVLLLLLTGAMAMQKSSS